MEKIQIKNPSDALPALKRWQKQRQENFIVITLDGAHQIIKVHHVTKGLVNKTIVHPREVFYPAIKDFSTAIMCVHNHPSGSVEPSPEDDEITDRICMAGSILGIRVLDHIIITRFGDYYSYRSNGRISDYDEYG